jgi:hypothetical protein
MYPLSSGCSNPSVALKIEALFFIEMSVTHYQSTRRNMPEALNAKARVIYKFNLTMSLSLKQGD